LSVPPRGGLYEMNLDGLLGLGDVVILAVGLPARRDDLNQNPALRYSRRTGNALLICVQVQLSFLVLGESEIHARLGYRLVPIASGHFDPNMAGPIAFFRGGGRLIGLRGERRPKREQT